MTRFSQLTFVVAGLLLAAPAGAYELEPGLWEEASTGTEDGKPAAPENAKRCISEADAQESAKALKLEEMRAGECQTADVNESGDTLTVKFRCKQGDDHINMDGTFKFSGRKAYSGNVKMSMAMFGKQATMERSIEAKWLSACP